MDRIPYDDPEIAKNADGVLKQLRRSLQLLASPAQIQLSHFPASWIVLTDEMALDFDHWTQCLSTYWEPSKEQMAKLAALDEILSEMSNSSRHDLGTEEALSFDPMWKEVRHLAKAALVSFGWPVDVPPPARLLSNGTVIDGE